VESTEPRSCNPPVIGGFSCRRNKKRSNEAPARGIDSRLQTEVVEELIATIPISGAWFESLISVMGGADKPKVQQQQ